MSDSTSHLDLLAVGQSQKDVSANTLFDAASPSMVYGRRASTTTLLTWGYYGGRINGTSIANGTKTGGFQAPMVMARAPMAREWIR